jgi:hypothetical protein
MRLGREAYWRNLRKKTTFNTITSYTTGSGAVAVTNGSTIVTITGATLITDGHFGLYLQPGKYGLAILSPQGVEEIDPKTGRLIPPPSRISLDYGSVTTSGLEAAVDEAHRRVDLRLDR